MPDKTFQFKIRQCQNPDCSLRYPVTEIKFDKETCPACGFSAPIAELFPMTPTVWNSSEKPVPTLEIVLDNLRSIFNVGSIFRTSDGTHLVKTLYLCGITPTPQHPKMKKTSLGAENSIPWLQHNNALTVCQQLKNEGKTLCAIEISDRSFSLYDLPAKFFDDPNLVLIFGNEVAGVDPAILSLCDYHLSIPMHGIKESLNVAIAFSVSLYHIYSLLNSNN